MILCHIAIIILAIHASINSIVAYRLNHKIGNGQKEEKKEEKKASE